MAVTSSPWLMNDSFVNLLNISFSQLMIITMNFRFINDILLCDFAIQAEYDVFNSRLARDSQILFKG